MILFIIYCHLFFFVWVWLHVKNTIFNLNGFLKRSFRREQDQLWSKAASQGQLATKQNYFKSSNASKQFQVILNTSHFKSKSFQYLTAERINNGLHCTTKYRNENHCVSQERILSIEKRCAYKKLQWKSILEILILSILVIAVLLSCCPAVLLSYLPALLPSRYVALIKYCNENQYFKF